MVKRKNEETLRRLTAQKDGLDGSGAQGGRKVGRARAAFRSRIPWEPCTGGWSDCVVDTIPTMPQDAGLDRQNALGAYGQLDRLSELVTAFHRNNVFLQVSDVVAYKGLAELPPTRDLTIMVGCGAARYSGLCYWRQHGNCGSTTAAAAAGTS